LSIFTTILASRIGSWQHYLKITSLALQVSMTLANTDLGFLHIIQRFKIAGRETNNLVVAEGQGISGLEAEFDEH
jgi:hypothetical protein